MRDLSLFDPAKRARIEDLWGRLLTKELNELAKSKTPNWYNRKFSKKWTPFYTYYSKRTKQLKLWGDPPNENVGGEYGRAPKRLPLLGKRKPVFIRESRIVGQHRVKGNKGFWITPKTYQPDASKVFKCRTSHTDLTIENTLSKPFYAKSNARRYPFPAMWGARRGQAPEFIYADKSVADQLVNIPEFEEILDYTFYLALSEIGD